jgi:muramoyltetrapeptide carboxypeptidase
MKRATMRSGPIGRLPVPRVRSIAKGAAHGRLAGGNLSVVAALSGGPFAVPCDGRVLILEDVREAPYRIDRMLTTLRINRDLARVSAVGLGAFPLCVPGPGDDNPSQTVEEVLDDRFFDIEKPVIRGLSVGHVEHQWTLPLGVIATVDANAGTFSVDEPAVL